MITINISNNNACAKCGALLTSGMVGARCAFSFGAEWNGLAKTAVFVAGNIQKDVLLTENECVIPWEVLEKQGYQLYVGVYGTNENGDLVIPTIYVNVGVIQKGADPSGDESTDPTLPVWAQIQGEIGDLSELETTAKDNLVEAINEAAQSGGGGGGTSDHRQLSNRDANNQHPINAITGLQSALDSKQPIGDYATTQDVSDLADIVDTKADASDIPSLDGYATEQWVENQGYLTEHQSLVGYATESYVDNHHDSTKQDVISDLATIRSGASKGATAVQPESGKGLFSGNYNDLTNKPTIPSAVTESTVSGWGFTKNTGTYSKPTTGIPKTDLASAVQTSLGKADSALQDSDTQEADTVTLATVATSGNYNDLTNKPTIPAAVTDAHINSLIDAKIDAIPNANGVSF